MHIVAGSTEDACDDEQKYRHKGKDGGEPNERREPAFGAVDAALKAEQKPIPVHGGHSGRREQPTVRSHQVDFGSIQGMIPTRRAALAQSGYRFSD
jgi:hypothetical protein